ncbi:MAG: hypothetical protein M0Z78_03125 [Betaproteobacteria bacterium]|nr:hypothetical protein [Betaproteobacteria bacterium]
MSEISTAFRNTYDLAFQVSPIILQGGIANLSVGNMLPIIALTGQLAGFAQGALTSGGLSTEDFFARFLPLPGATVISNAAGMYPFANQSVASNAIIKQPTSISMLMICPTRTAGGYLTKMAILTALKNSLNTHIALGGTFIIATPGFIYTNCLLLTMTDVTGGDTKQQQVQFQLDFLKPLITQEDASSAFSSLMNALSNGLQTSATPSWSGAASAVGASIQGAVQSVSGISGAVSQFLSGPAL